MNTVLESVLARLYWMHDERLWPDGHRYLWTDAWGVLLYVSLFEETANERWLDTAEALVAEVERVLGRPCGLRIGGGPERQGQYYHYLAKWMFALQRLGRHRAGYREKAIQLVRQVHPRFVVPGVGVVWKMSDDLSASCPGFGLGTIDPFHGYVVYRLIDEHELEREIADLAKLVERCYPSLHIDQDLGLASRETNPHSWKTCGSTLKTDANPITSKRHPPSTDASKRAASGPPLNSMTI